MKIQHRRRQNTQPEACRASAVTPETRFVCVGVCVTCPDVYTDHFVKLTGLMEEEDGRGSALTHTHTPCPSSANHTKRSDHTYRIHPNHTKRRAQHTHTWKQPLYLSVHPTHRIQPDGGRHRLLAPVTVSQHQRPAVNARDCIKCNCVRVFVCVSPIVQQAWLRRRPAGAQTGSQIIGLCSDPNTHTLTLYTSWPAYTLSTVLTVTPLLIQYGQTEHTHTHSNAPTSSNKCKKMRSDMWDTVLCPRTSQIFW